MTTDRIATLAALERKVLWLATWMIHNANHLRPSADGLKVGGHQASSASIATIMTALYFSVLGPEDQVAVKPHASPIFHAIQYLFGQQTLEKLRDSGLGRHPRPRLPGEPARGRPAAAGLHRQLGRRHDDRLPDGPRRPDRRRGPVVLHHLAGAAVRHDRPAGRRAEHHRPGRLGMEHADYLDACAPRSRPCSASAPATSSTSRGAWDTFREAKLIYGRLGHGERVDLFESDEPHGSPGPAARRRCRWMRRWLLERTTPRSSPTAAIATDAELQVHPEPARSSREFHGQVGLRPQRRAGRRAGAGSGPSDSPAGRPRLPGRGPRAARAARPAGCRWSSPAMRTRSAATGTRSTGGPSPPSRA